MVQTASNLPATGGSDSTAPARFTDWRPLDNLRHEIDQVFDSFRNGLWHRPSFFAPDVLSAANPAADVVENDGAYEVTAELPGIEPTDIDIKFANDMLTISGEKKAEKEEKRKNYYLSERRYGAFQRVFQLPPGVDSEKIGASFHKGILKVTLPKDASSRNGEKKIPVVST